MSMRSLHSESCARPVLCNLCCVHCLPIFRAAIRRICPTLQSNLRSPDYGQIQEFTHMHRLTPSQVPERSQDPKRHTHNKRTCQGKLLAMNLARMASSLAPAETGGEENAGARRLRSCQCSKNTASVFLSTCLQVSLARLAKEKQSRTQTRSG